MSAMADDPSKPNLIMANAKAIAGALVSFAGAVLLIAADPKTSALLPQNWVQWAVAAASAVTVLGTVFGIPNQRSVKQAQEDLDAARRRRET
jgi:hypothetical protein